MAHVIDELCDYVAKGIRGEAFLAFKLPFALFVLSDQGVVALAISVFFFVLFFSRHFYLDIIVYISACLHEQLGSGLVLLCFDIRVR